MHFHCPHITFFYKLILIQPNLLLRKFRDLLMSPMDCDRYFEAFKVRGTQGHIFVCLLAHIQSKSLKIKREKNMPDSLNSTDYMYIFLKGPTVEFIFKSK